MNDAPTPENMNRGHVDTSYMCFVLFVWII